MFKSCRALRFEPLEGRMMLSINVGIEDNTISVTSDDGADDIVAIEQTWSGDSVTERLLTRSPRRPWRR